MHISKYNHSYIQISHLHAEQMPDDRHQKCSSKIPLFFETDSQLPKIVNKQKLVMHRASMRSYIEEVLRPNVLMLKILS